MEAVARGAHVEATIERLHRLAQRKVAPRPGVRAREVPREEPVRGPFAEAAHRRQPRLDLVIRPRGEPSEVEVGARKPDDVLRLAPREPEREELVLARACEPLPYRERPRLPHLYSEPLDDAVADRGRRVKGDLLRRD